MFIIASLQHSENMFVHLIWDVLLCLYNIKLKKKKNYLCFLYINMPYS